MASENQTTSTTVQGMAEPEQNRDGNSRQSMEESYNGLARDQIPPDANGLGITSNISTGPGRPNKKRDVKYKSIATRKETFPLNAFSSNPETVLQLATAGFYFVGLPDHIRCFWCALFLRNFRSGQDPWIQHARNNPTCEFVLCNLGKVCVDIITQTSRHATLQDVLIQMEERGLSKHLVFNEERRVNVKNMLLELNLMSGRDGNEHVSDSRTKADTSTQGDAHLRQCLTCKKCNNMTAEILTLPCRHVVLCVSCAFSVHVCPDLSCSKDISKRIALRFD